MLAVGACGTFAVIVVVGILLIYLLSKYPAEE